MNRVLIVLCLIIGVGCSAIRSDNEAGRTGLSSEQVGSVQSALSSRFVLTANPILNGTVETLICDGVACVRTCSNADPTRCSTRCQNSSQVPRAQPFLDLSVLRTDCQMDAN